MDIGSYLKFWTLSPSKRKKIVTSRYKDVFDITYTTLKKDGVKLMIFDIDDTLTEHLGLVEGDIYKLIERIHSKDMHIGIYSNCKQERYEELKAIFKDYPEIYIVDKAQKPNPSNYLEITQHFDVKPEQSAMVGDKVGTDLFGAFLAGFKHRILVEPYSSVIGGKKTTLFQRVIRSLEKKLS